MTTGQDFKKFAMSRGISSLKLDTFENSMTPYVLEERQLRATQIDIFSRLMMDRILWVSGEVNQNMSDIVQSQLLYLDSNGDKGDITLYINSPGGSVLCGLGIVDLMNYIKCDVATVNIGMCASMASILLSSGTKGKRSSLINSKVMVHQVSSGASGHVDDNRISQMEAEKYNYILFKMLAKNCGKTFDEVYEASNRDKWFNSDQALEFGLIDEIIGVNEKNQSITSMLDGFDDHYKKLIEKSK